MNQFAPNKFKKGRFFDNLPKDKSKPADETKQVFSSFTPEGVFSSDYMNKNINGNVGSTNKQKNELEKNTTEMMKTIKDPLFQKFSSKDTSKVAIPKYSTIRTKPF